MDRKTYKEEKYLIESTALEIGELNEKLRAIANMELPIENIDKEMNIVGEEMNKEAWIEFSEVQDKLGIALKDKKNPHFGQAYSTLKSCNDVIKTAIEGRGFVVNHRIKQQGDTSIVETKIIHKGLAMDSSEYPFSSSLKDQQKGSAISYGKRYNLCALFNLDSDDDDGNAAQGKAPYQAPIPQAQNGDPGSYVRKVGKDKGSPLNSFNKSQLEKFVSWTATLDDVKGALLEDLNAIKAYLK